MKIEEYLLLIIFIVQLPYAFYVAYDLLKNPNRIKKHYEDLDTAWREEVLYNIHQATKNLDKYNPEIKTSMRRNK